MGNECTSIAVFILFIGMEFSMVRMINIHIFCGINIHLEKKKQLEGNIAVKWNWSLLINVHQGVKSNMFPCLKSVFG